MKLKAYIAALFGILLAASPAWSTSGTLTGVGKPATVASSPTVSYIGFNVPTVTSLVATASGASIGTAAADRVVAVVIHTTNSFVSLSSVTVGGTGATIATTDFQNGSFSGIAYLPFASGATANIVVTFSGGISDASIVLIEVYNLNGLSSSTPTGTGHNSSGSATTLTTGNFTTTSGGVAIIGSSQNSVGSTTDTITGTTGTITANHANFAIDGFSSTTTASATGVATSATSNYTATWNGTAQTSTLVAAAWR